MADQRNGFIGINLLVWDRMKGKYTCALGVLPVVLTFGSLAPHFLLLASIGVDVHAPLLRQGALVSTISVVLMLVFMVGGYLLGFVLNAVILRFWTGWSRDQVRALLLSAQPPPHWLKSETDWRNPLGSEAVAASWAATRKMGQARFVFVRGTFGWGVWMFLLMYIRPLKFGFPYKMNPTEHTPVGQALLWGIAGTLWGFVTWHVSDRLYPRESSAPE